MKKRILVFPCGSEIAMEVYRSVKFDRHFTLIGANSVDDHGKYVFHEYLENVPFVGDKKFLPRMKELVKKHRIDAIIPTMDVAITALKPFEVELSCVVVGSAEKPSKICASKSATYKALRGIVPVPETLNGEQFPLFAKPDQGASSRGAKRINNKLELDEYSASRYEKFVLLEFLPGKEYTIDCFSDRYGCLRFCQARQRVRVSNGISVNTRAVKMPSINDYAHKINSTLHMRGAWFFQMKEDSVGELKLLEVGARLGGSSALCRAIGVNFALLSLYDAFEIDVEIVKNDYAVELDRALKNSYQINIKYDSVFIDWDDCLLVNGLLNSEMMAFLAQCKNKSKKIYIISRHNGDLLAQLRGWGVENFFDAIIHLTDGSAKSKCIGSQSSIFIDDSFLERREVHLSTSIPVFSPDMVECLLDARTV